MPREGNMYYSVISLRKQLVAAALMLACCLPVVVSNAQAADAYTVNCFGFWSSPPQVVVHTSEFWAGGGGDAILDLLDAVQDVNDEFNQVGGTRLLLASDGVPSTSVFPIELNTPFLDNVLAPKIHIGFTSDPNDLPALPTGQTARAATSFPTCPILTEARMVFLAPDQQGWNFSTPQESGEDYSTAERADSTGALWFRQVYLHELLHTFGLGHSADSYAL
jgi:hypothetical protein